MYASFSWQSLTESLTDLGGVEEAVVVADPSLQLDKDQAPDLFKIKMKNS